MRLQILLATLTTLLFQWWPCPAPLFVKDEKRAGNITADFASLQSGDKHSMDKKIGKRQIKSEFLNIRPVPEIKGKKRLWDHLTVCSSLTL